jgi:hypothetical protein
MGLDPERERGEVGGALPPAAACGHAANSSHTRVRTKGPLSVHSHCRVQSPARRRRRALARQELPLHRGQLLRRPGQPGRRRFSWLARAAYRSA